MFPVKDDTIITDSRGSYLIKRPKSWYLVMPVHGADFLETTKKRKLRAFLKFLIHKMWFFH